MRKCEVNWPAIGDKCSRCGAPQCRPQCCKESKLEFRAENT